MSGEHQKEQPEEPGTPASREFVDLKFIAFRSEMRMLFILAVAGNQLLSHLSFSPVGYIGSGLAAGLVAVKLFLVR